MTFPPVTKKSADGFTLVEIMVVTVIVGLIMSLTAYGLRPLLVARRVNAEKTKVERIAEEIHRSFSVADFANNIACVSGYPASLGGVDAASLTSFGAVTVGSGGAWSVPTTHWAAKLSRQRGDVLSATGSSYSTAPTINTGIYEIVANSFAQPRMLFAGPPDELINQRYLLISIMAPAERGLVIPAAPSNAADYKAWFDAIWGTIWDGDQPPPALWASLLSSSAYQNWTRGSEGGRSNTGRLVVHKITQKKYRVTLNNNVNSVDARLRVLGSTTPFMAVTGTANEDSTVEIPVGRRVLAETRPTGSSSAWEVVQRQNITADGTTFTLQGG